MSQVQSPGINDDTMHNLMMVNRRTAQALDWVRWQLLFLQIPSFPKYVHHFILCLVRARWMPEPKFTLTLRNICAYLPAKIPKVQRGLISYNTTIPSSSWNSTELPHTNHSGGTNRIPCFLQRKAESALLFGFPWCFVFSFFIDPAQYHVFCTHLPRSRNFLLL